MKQIKDSEYQEYQQYVYNRIHGHIWTPATLDLICEVNNNNPEEIGKQILEGAAQDEKRAGFHPENR